MAKFNDKNVSYDNSKVRKYRGEIFYLKTYGSIFQILQKSKNAEVSLVQPNIFMYNRYSSKRKDFVEKRNILDIFLGFLLDQIDASLVTQGYRNINFYEVRMMHNYVLYTFSGIKNNKRSIIFSAYIDVTQDLTGNRTVNIVYLKNNRIVKIINIKQGEQYQKYILAYNDISYLNPGNNNYMKQIEKLYKFKESDIVSDLKAIRLAFLTKLENLGFKNIYFNIITYHQNVFMEFYGDYDEYALYNCKKPIMQVFIYMNKTSSNSGYYLTIVKSKMAIIRYKINADFSSASKLKSSGENGCLNDLCLDLIKEVLTQEVELDIKKAKEIDSLFKNINNKEDLARFENCMNRLFNFRVYNYEAIY